MRPAVTTLIALFLSSVVGVYGQTPLVPSTFPGDASSTSSSSSSSRTSSVSVNATSSQTSSSIPPFPSLGGYPTCVTDCLAQASAAASCNSVVDVNCFCPNPHFTDTLDTCIFTQCPDQLKSAQNLAQQFCNLTSPSPTTSLSFPPVPSFSSSSSASSSSSSSSSAPSASNTSNAAESIHSWTSLLSVLTVGALALA
ncbi:hypothetical protein BDN72DRAFT_850471 [Pluteus cervinus]|uniref:Uncharacterized protein n=1 Tax=Pluteus cervinus TaxID=181527 RepID=A0ACD3A5D5_9AGAR|nr:hypothetical protein BDN72DRAFT_850471 [Pluteus cervinus]